MRHCSPKPSLALALVALWTLLLACSPPSSPDDTPHCALAAEASCLCAGGELGELRCDMQRGALSCSCPGARARAPMTPDLPDLDMERAFEEMGEPDLPDMSPMPEPLLECEEIAGVMLPPEFETGDIGPVQIEGSTLAQGERVCMEASGRDIWSTSDEFRFTSRTWSGDFDMRVLVSELTGSDRYTKAGLMVRESRDADARFIMLQLTQFENPFIIGRANPGANNASSTPNTAGNAPFWLRLVRRGSRFTSFVSRDGASWTASGEMWLEAMPQDTHIGLALSNHNNTALAHVTFDHFQATSPDSPCPAQLDCAALDAIDGFDYAARAAIGSAPFSRALFSGSDVQTFTVTDANDFPGGPTLRGRIIDALRRASLGKYTIIEVDTTQVTSPILLNSPLETTQKIWLKGNGAVIRGARSPLPAECLPPLSAMCQVPTDGFVLGSESILEGFVLERFDRAVRSSGETSGVLITHNTFSEGTGPFIELSDTNGKTRHFTISYNHFAPSGTPDGMRAVELQRRCEPESACPDDTSSLFVSLHHNRFGPSVSAGYPYGSAKLVYTNNLVEDLSSEGVDLGPSGQVLSRHNIFQTHAMTPVNVWRRGANSAGTNPVGDLYEGNVNGNRGEQALSFSPVFPLQLYIERDELLTLLDTMAGPLPNK